MAQYVCSNCGFGSASWYGKCPSCHDWDTFKEFHGESKKSKRSSTRVAKVPLTRLNKVKATSGSRLSTKIHEFDRVLGGGFVPGEVVLLAGEPGVGKSTILLSIIAGKSVVYISGEESGEQIQRRAQRIEADTSDVQFSSSAHVESIIKTLESVEDFDICIIDSIQTVYSSTANSSIGSVSQIKASASLLTEYAKRNNKVLVMVGHVTKGGDIAGPKTLEHLVDCVLYLEGEKESQFRLLRANKNRFGSTDEVGIFEMKEKGLTEVSKPTMFTGESDNTAVGRALIGSVEGSRALFYEIQSLVVPTELPVPRRVVSGVDFNRVQLLLAVVRKHLKISLDSYDIYINVVGGLSAKSPSADLGIVASVVSSVKNKPLPNNSVFIGEIGLLGEVRSVYREGKVLQDAKRFGLKKIYTSKNVSTVKQLRTIL